MKGKVQANGGPVVLLLLGTSFVIERETEVAARQLGPARRFLAARSREPVAISIVTVGEFAEGFATFSDVEAFLSPFRVVPLSRNIAYRKAALQVGWSQRLGENDAWIAATALAYDALLVAGILPSSGSLALSIIGSERAAWLPPPSLSSLLELGLAGPIHGLVPIVGSQRVFYSQSWAQTRTRDNPLNHLSCRR